MDGSLGTESKSKKAPAAAKSADPGKDYISTLLLELGQARAIVDLLWMVACGKGVDSVDGMCGGTVENSLHTVLQRLSAVEDAAEAILEEKVAPRGATG